MFVVGVVTLIFASTSTGEAPRIAPRDSGVGAPAAACACLTMDTAIATRSRFVVPADTPRARPRAVELSEWYDRRLQVHRYVSYAVVPLFGAELLSERRLFREGSAAPAWAKTTHRVVTATLLGAFGVNTVTGVWNLWDSRRQPGKRTLRTAHAILMLAAEGGFTYAATRVPDDADASLARRREHRAWTLSSMGVAAASALMMRLFNQ